MKINDLYLTTKEVLDLALAKDLVPVLAALLGHVPALCNSLYLERSSTQEPHVDALYMTPLTPDHLIAAWVAGGHARRLRSTRIFPQQPSDPTKLFSDGRYHFIQDEMADWRRYIAAALAEADIESRFFAAQKGDVLFWHANLLHGGGTIANPSLTRKSCVFHYFSEADARQGSHRLIPHAGAFWIARSPQSLPPSVAAQLPFSEQNYLARYPDVAAAVKAGNIATGYAHYQAYGQAEGRLPC